jgi:ectoine hydroxylase-related dioxygenase (phytanoyl-CoA dioxygenase family)
MSSASVQNRRFTRLTNAFSKKFENHVHALALYFMFYNFVRVHKTLRMSPAMAAGLLEVEGVRLYHDQSLYKEAGGGFTPAHCDQGYWPLASDRSVTAWVPLQATPDAMGPLGFYAGSQGFEEGRGLHISDESERRITERMQAAGYPYVCSAFDLGEVSFHQGWTYHRAGPNMTDTPRSVMTVIYMDAAMRLKEPANKMEAFDRAVWTPGAVVGEVIDTPLNPVLFP